MVALVPAESVKLRPSWHNQFHVVYDDFLEGLHEGDYTVPYEEMTLELRHKHSRRHDKLKNHLGASQ